MQTTTDRKTIPRKRNYFLIELTNSILVPTREFNDIMPLWYLHQACTQKTNGVGGAHNKISTYIIQ